MWRVRYSTLGAAHWAAALVLNDWGVEASGSRESAEDNFMLFCADILRRSNDRIYLKNRKNLRSNGRAKPWEEFSPWLGAI